MRRSAALIVRGSSKGGAMWWGIGIEAFVYVCLLTTFGLGLAYKGRWAG
jgi:hypothetical protein